MSARRGQYLPHTGNTPKECAHCAYVYVGGMPPSDYAAKWQRLVRVNVPRRLRIAPRETYADVLRVFEVA